MSCILLLGAGFSRNWGGWLTSEVTSDLGMRLQGDVNLSQLLQRNGNFEEALADVQAEYVRSKSAEATARLKKFQDALAATFADMNKALAQVRFEFQEDHGIVDKRFTVREFLTKFDAIFSLNQDLLVEVRYLYPPGHIALADNKKWQHGELPGMEEIADASRTGLYDPLAARRRPRAPPFTTDPRLQPYFKLHGSSNWIDKTGEQLLVMGGNKPTTIQQHPVLKWYADQFMVYLSQAGARLMVIGYGFGDLHINQMIQQAWERSQLTMFIVHPDGRGILRKINPTNTRPLYCPGPLESITVFDSTRPLAEIFGGRDPGEHGRLVRFVTS